MPQEAQIAYIGLLYLSFLLAAILYLWDHYAVRWSGPLEKQEFQGIIAAYTSIWNSRTARPLTIALAVTATSGDPEMKVLVIDDHALVREALRGLIRKLGRDAVLLDASNCTQAIRILEQHPDLDLILLDLTLPERDGFSMLAELREHHPTTAVVVLSGSNERHDVNRALKLGALGYIPKTTSHDVMLSALELVFAGGIYIPPEILNHEPYTNGEDTGSRSPLVLGLTNRQAEVLELLAQGKSNKAIGRTLGLAMPTVKNHITAILKALKATTRTEAVVAIQKLRLKLPR